MAPLIRLATAADAAAVHALYAPLVRDTHISFETAPPTMDEMRARVDGVIAQGYPWLVYEDDGDILGYAYAGRFRSRAAYEWSTETSINVAEGARGRGVGRALYESLLAVLALQGYHTACAVIALPNAPSVALHRAVGFREVGTLERVGHKGGSWRDTLWMQRHLAEPGAVPVQPLPVAEAGRRPGWEAALGAGLANRRAHDAPAEARGFVLREAGPADAEAIARLLGELGHPTPAADVPRRLAAMRAEGGQALLADDRALGPVGLMTLSSHAALHAAGPVAYITALVTTEAVRGRGVGRALVAAAFDWARRRGCVRLSVTSAERRAGAHAFYPRCGLPYTGRRFSAAIEAEPPADPRRGAGSPG